MHKAFIVGGCIAGLIVLVTLLPDGPPRSVRSPQRSGRAVTLSTSRIALEGIVASSRARVATDPGNGEAAVLLADALMRTARVNTDALLPMEAERALRAALKHGPFDYAATRMLGVVLLAQHRFADALEAARQAQAMRPDDAWNYAVAGDALLELGRYDEAFDAFDQVVSRRPDAAAYARLAYARELQGDIDGAIELMRMAGEATGAHDPEAQAWTFAQLGNLLLLQQRLEEAEREFERAEFTFPSHPYVAAGRVRLLVARRRYVEALQLAERSPDTPESWAVRGDLLTRLNAPTAAEAAYRQAEWLERDGWKTEQPQPGALARFLAERGRNIPEAVALAEQAAAEREDIHTFDALAWAYFRAGRLDDAAQAIARATRTGTVDPRIRCHAAAIATARAGTTPREGEVCDPLDVAIRFGST